MYEVDAKLSRPGPLGVRWYLWLFQMPLAMYDYKLQPTSWPSVLMVNEDISQPGASNEKQMSYKLATTRQGEPDDPLRRAAK